MRLLIYLGCIVVSFLSCSHKKEDSRQIIAQWYDKEIVLPSNLIFKNYKGETTPFQNQAYEYKVVTYINGDNCVLCKLKMDLWRECKEFLQKKQGGNIPFLFYIHYQNHAEIEYIFKSHKFEYPFCFDDKDELNKINKLPKDDRFRTFLLDKNNHVIAIGNPTTNLKIRNLYAKLVSKNEEAIADSPSCIFSPTQLNCGELRLGKTYQYRINIQNILEKTVKIDTIIPSCECMDISHTPDSIKPSGSSYFIVTYHADIAGDLFKTAHIYTKGEESPYMITWEGTVQ